ncbi:hypothetical protein [Algibacter sp. L1A34]|uniref:hypothetical protein n=1 Tax=Algibacter sp. L1A34 TaxID=2686365 RepID=UPI00131C0F3A|nr:hypothetical protein [Algibacter sp. L1A34]
MTCKNHFSLLLLFLFSCYAFSQKLTPDTDLISELVSQKQDEVKQRILKNLIVKNIKTTNYTTYKTMYDLMEVITNEKNKTVMTKSILAEITEYAICYSLANYFRVNLSNSQPEFALDSLIVNPDKNALNFLINDEFSANNNVEARTKDEDKLEAALIANYIMDEMNDKLLSSEFSFFESNGLFDKKDLEKKFTYGLDTGYKKIDSDIKLDISNKMQVFIDDIDSISDASYEVFNLIDSLKNNSLQFDQLKSAKEGVIKVVFDLFSISLSDFEQEIGRNSFLAKIGEIINKYVIYESFEGDNDMVFEFKIDVESIILSFEEEFINIGISSIKEHKIGIKPFFIIGLNYGSFTGSNSTILNNDNTDNISDISYVSEKIGVKLILFDFGYTRSQKPKEWYKYRGKYRKWNVPSADPLIDDVYLSVYGSGILYNVVDLKSQDNFDFPLVGLGGGITFFNNLEFNISYSVPVINNSMSYDNSMVSFGFDIPIFEYLGALKKKNAN